MTTLTISAECANGYPEACRWPRCEAAEHLPARDDDEQTDREYVTHLWAQDWDSPEDEDASWLEEDRRAERRADV